MTEKEREEKSLTHRLRGYYPLGNFVGDEPEFGWRYFEPVNYDGSPAKGRAPIMEEAAIRIEYLESEVARLKEALNEKTDDLAHVSNDVDISFDIGRGEEENS